MKIYVSQSSTAHDLYHYIGARLTCLFLQQNAVKCYSVKLINTGQWSVFRRFLSNYFDLLLDVLSHADV